MPKAKLPTSLKGWVAALVASFIGFIFGFWVLKIIDDIWG